MQHKLNVGLVGFGHAGKYLHMPFLLAAGFEIVLVATSRDSEVKESLPHAEVVSDMADIINRDDIDLAVLATPTQYHLEHALAAIAARKPVVIEKPFGVDLLEALKISTAAHQAGVDIFCYHNRRWDSDYLLTKKVIMAGGLGPIHAYTARWDRYRPIVRSRWREDGRPGSGVLLDLGPHLIDQSVQLFGKPSWVQADLLYERIGAVSDDGFTIRMGGNNLPRITLEASSLSLTSPYRYAVEGKYGGFIKKGLDVQEKQIRAGISPLSRQFGKEPKEFWGTLILPDGNSMRLRPPPGQWITFYKNVAACLKKTSSPAVTIDQAVFTMRILEAARLSALNHVRISLP